MNWLQHSDLRIDQSVCSMWIVKHSEERAPVKGLELPISAALEYRRHKCSTRHVELAPSAPAELRGARRGLACCETAAAVS